MFLDLHHQKACALIFFDPVSCLSVLGSGFGMVMMVGNFHNAVRLPGSTRTDEGSLLVAVSCFFFFSSGFPDSDICGEAVLVFGFICLNCCEHVCLILEVSVSSDLRTIESFFLCCCTFFCSSTITSYI